MLRGPRLESSIGCHRERRNSVRTFDSLHSIREVNETNSVSDDPCKKEKKKEKLKKCWNLAQKNIYTQNNI